MEKKRIKIRRIDDETLDVLIERGYVPLLGKEDKVTIIIKIDNNKIEDMTLIELDLSCRSHNALNKVGVKTVGDILTLISIGELTNVKNLGVKSCKEVYNKLEDLGIDVEKFKCDNK